MFISKFGTHTLDNKSTPEVSLSYMYDHFLRRDYSNILPMSLDMKGYRIKRLSMKPEDTNDAVSAAFVIQESINMEQKALLRNGIQSMTGHLNMDSHYIHNVLDPVNNQDVATKSYVDTTNKKAVITILAVKKKTVEPSKMEWTSRIYYVISW